MSKHGEVGRAAVKAGFDRATGRRYLALGQTPSELAPEGRAWRTREDPFVEDWPTVEEMLKDAPTLEGKALFEWLVKERPGRYHYGQLVGTSKAATVQRV